MRVSAFLAPPAAGSNGGTCLAAGTSELSSGLVAGTSYALRASPPRLAVGSLGTVTAAPPTPPGAAPAPPAEASYEAAPPGTPAAAKLPAEAQTELPVEGQFAVAAGAAGPPAAGRLAPGAVAGGAVGEELPFHEPYSISGGANSSRAAPPSGGDSGLLSVTYTPYSTPSSTTSSAADLSVFTSVLLDAASARLVCRCRWPPDALLPARMPRRQPSRPITRQRKRLARP